MELDSDASSGAAELWRASLERCVLDDDEVEVVRGPVVAWARVYRVHFDSDDWYEDLDVESFTAELVGAAFLEREEFEDDDLLAAFSPGLIVIDHIEAPKQWRGSKLSHGLIRGVLSVFRDHHFGLFPSEMSQGADGKHRLDRAKQDALRLHWEGVGFGTIPGSDVMWLPFKGRSF